MEVLRCQRLRRPARERHPYPGAPTPGASQCVVVRVDRSFQVCEGRRERGRSGFARRDPALHGLSEHERRDRGELAPTPCATSRATPSRRSCISSSIGSTPRSPAAVLSQSSISALPFAGSFGRRPEGGVHEIGRAPTIASRPPASATNMPRAGGLEIAPCSNVAAPMASPRRCRPRT